MSFLYDMHGANVFDSHLPCRAHAALKAVLDLFSAATYLKPDTLHGNTHILVK